MIRHVLAVATLCFLADPSFAADIPVVHNDMSIVTGGSVEPRDLPLPEWPATHSAPAAPVTPPSDSMLNEVKHVFSSVGAWVQANPGWSAIIFVALATMLINTLGKYPRAAGFVGFLRKAIDLVAPFTHTASPGTWKPPLVTIRDGKLALSLSQPPTEQP